MFVPSFLRWASSEPVAEGGLDATAPPASSPALTIALLSNARPAWLATLPDQGQAVICLDGAEATLAPRLCPDVLVLDMPLVLAPQRVALLIRQLRWGRPELVIAVADGMIGRKYGFDHDLNFDPRPEAGEAADALAVAVTLAQVRRQTGTAKSLAAPALLRRNVPRKIHLFD